jgi:hypothetical protein
MKKVFLILLFSILNINLLGQVYHIEFGSLELFNDETLDNYDDIMLTFTWSNDDDLIISLKDYVSSYAFSSRLYTGKFLKSLSVKNFNSDRASELCPNGSSLYTFTNDGLCKFGISISQNLLELKLNDISSNVTHYCALEIINFTINSLPLSILTKIYVTLVQNSNEQFYSNLGFKSNSFSIVISTLSNLIEPTESFKVKVYIKTLQNNTFTISKNIAPIYPYVEIDESKLAVVDDKFYYPELHGSQKITFKNIKTALKNNINANSTEPYNLENYYGLYNVIIEEEKRCPITKSFIYPKLQYNYVNEPFDYNFWYSGEKKDAVKLSLYEVQEADIHISDIKISPNMSENCINNNVKVSYKKDGGEIGTYSCTEHIYTLSTTDTLSQIKITSSNKDFIPITRTIELKSYPNISKPEIKSEDATCYYDTAVVTISDIEGGLDNGYKFMLEKDDKQIWTDKNPIKIPATIFGGDEQEVKLYVLDKDSISDDSGRLKRAFSTNINFNYGETLDIKNWQVADLKCFEDNTDIFLFG